VANIITITHRTEYTYVRPVILNPHRLMLRPRDGHDLWVDDAFLTVHPRATLRWYFDTFGNSVAEASWRRPRLRQLSGLPGEFRSEAIYQKARRSM
jgi:transglutaminase-like putative cysteine protease